MSKSDEPGLQPISAIIDRLMSRITNPPTVNEEAPMTQFSEIDQLALRKGGWRVLPEQADRALKGEIIVTVKATGHWAVVEKGETVAIGSGEYAMTNALEAFTAAAKVRARRILASVA